MSSLLWFHHYLSLWEHTIHSALDESLPAEVAPGSGDRGVAVDSKTAAYQERMKQLREQQKKAKEERKKIADQIKADRREADQREARSSVSFICVIVIVIMG